MVSFISKLRGFVEEFPLRFVQDSHQIFFLNLRSGIATDSVIFANDLGWIRIPKKWLWAHHFRAHYGFDLPTLSVRRE